MRILTLCIFGLLASIFAHGQTGCNDSSSHFSYQPVVKDSFYLNKQTLLANGDKLFVGYSYAQVNSSLIEKKSLVGRIGARGDVLWTKDISYLETNNPFPFSIQSIVEAENGNIILITTQIQTDDRPFFSIALSPDGTLLKSNKFGFTDLFPSGVIPPLGDRRIRSPLIIPINQDSVLLLYSIDPIDFKEIYILVEMDNQGNIGNTSVLRFPFATSVHPYLDRGIIKNNHLKLFGSGIFNNSCADGSNANQTAFQMVEIDLITKQVINIKAYCNPLFGLNQKYFIQPKDLYTFDTKHNIFLLKNGHFIFTRTAMGLEALGADTLNRLFSISEFDENFNHVKSEYITTGNRFKRNCYYDIVIDSINNRYIYVVDRNTEELYYAKSDSLNRYSYQKKMPFKGSDPANIFMRHPFIEPGYAHSFNVIATYDGKSHLENFRILARDTGEACFGTKEEFLSTRPATPTPIPWVNDFTSQSLTIDAVVPNITLIDYPFERTIVCNIVSKCDFLKINAPPLVCNDSLNVVITATKNNLCNGKINFLFDTSKVISHRQIDDTTIFLRYAQAYTGKVYARPANCNQLIDSATITIVGSLAKINLGADTVFCPGKSYRLTAHNIGFQSYQWQDGSTDSVFTATAPGEYYVTSIDYCNRSYADTINLLPVNSILKIEKDTVICFSESVILQATKGFTNYLWQPVDNQSQPNPYTIVVSPTQTTQYTLTAEKFKGCLMSDTITVTVTNCPEYVFFPNSFTPNNDGKNDEFKSLNGGALKKYSLTVYNREGRIVFSTNDRNNGWDGKYKNMQLASGVFVWVCKYQFNSKNEVIKKGTVTLIR